MKRNLLKSLFVTLALVFTAIAAQAQCYIIGNDGKWLTNEAGAATYDRRWCLRGRCSV